MSTITYRAGVMASDTRAYSGSNMPIGQKKKLYLLKDGSAVGVTSPNPGQPEAFADWLDNGKQGKPNFDPGLNALHVYPDGRIFYYSDSFLPAGPLEGEYFAIGSGAKYALGAMACGADATQAIGIAAQFDPLTGGMFNATRVVPEPVAEPEPFDDTEDADFVRVTDFDKSEDPISD